MNKTVKVAALLGSFVLLPAYALARDPSPSATQADQNSDSLRRARSSSVFQQAKQPAPQPAPAVTAPAPARDPRPIGTSTVVQSYPGSGPVTVQAPTDRAETGFHFGLGLGVSGDYDNGVATQFKIGVRVTPALRIYFYALNHWYNEVVQESPSKTTSESRIRALNGLGIDHFFLPSVALRMAAGIGADTKPDLFSDAKRALGYSVAFGASVELAGGPAHQLTLDPMIHKISYNAKDRYEGAASDWISTTIVLLTLCWSYR